MFETKNKYIKLIAALLIFVMLLGTVAGCGDKSDGQDDVNETQTGSIADAEDGMSPSEIVALQSEHYTVTNDMFAFFFYKDYYDALEYYYDSYYYYYKLNPTVDLKEQTYNDGSSWFDYFITITYKNVANYLLFAEAAIDEGIELDETDIASVEAEIAGLEESAQAEGYTTQEFLDYRFGYDVDLETVRECIELYTLGTKYYDQLVDSISISENDIEEYYEENEQSFLYVDYRKVEVRADTTEYASVSEQEAGYAAAKATAEKIAASKNISEYVDRSVAYYKSINDTLDEPLTDDEIYTKVTNITAQYSYRETSFAKWAFAEGRKSGDITMLDNGAGIYTVYYLQNAPYRAENATKNIRMVSFSAESFDDESQMREAADELYAKWKELGGDGEALKEAATALELSEGSLKEAVDLGETQPVVENWLFNSERQPGDCEILDDGSACYMVYFEGDGEISWKVTATEALENEQINNIFSGFAQKYSVDYNLNNMNLLSGVTVYTETEE